MAENPRDCKAAESDPNTRAGRPTLLPVAEASGRRRKSLFTAATPSLHQRCQKEWRASRRRRLPDVDMEVRAVAPLESSGNGTGAGSTSRGTVRELNVTELDGVDDESGKAS